MNRQEKAKRSLRRNVKKKTDDDPSKKKYAEFVSMEEREYQSLVDKYGEKATEKLIELLDNYKGSSGKTYKSDYRAILNWVVDKAQKGIPETVYGAERHAG